MLAIAQRSLLPSRRAGWGSRNGGVAFLWGFIFLQANSSNGRLIGCAVPPPCIGPGVRAAEGCWLRCGIFHGLGMQSPDVTATQLPGRGDVGPTWVAPWVFVAGVLSDVGF